ncbi:MAG: hypothetical protein U5O39_10630 [Gammaproteobacteria bacterium]|nr:hypothetical protein [Gammaproteobacteria bacterium]
MASLFYLMTRYAGSPSPALAEAIADHFEMLRYHPDGGDEVIAKAGRRLGADVDGSRLGAFQPMCSLTSV